MTGAVVVMGPSGCGKSTLGRALAESLGWHFIEGDSLHPPANIGKMSAGNPLTDADRVPFLDAVAAALAAGRATGIVISCSALKRSYRQLLRDRAGDVIFVLPQLDRAQLAARHQQRSGHFMPQSLLDSQLADLEMPGADELVVVVDGATTTEAQCTAFHAWTRRNSMKTRLHIDFVSDVACPWCAVGLFSLEEALRRTADVVAADITFQPFELNPDMPPAGENHAEHIGRKFGGNAAQLSAGREAIRERAASLGFAFNVTADSRIYNTFDCHRLLHWAHTLGRHRELKRALLKANFTDNADIADADVLVGVAAATGLDATEARAVLASGRYAAEVRAAEQLWLSRGINSVPGIVINRKWLISGGQPPEVFEDALRRIAQTQD
jgi:carbohydrate kinase (thermoresistant glucokinase family)